MSNGPIKMLLVEDNVGDARIVQHLIKQSGHPIQIEWVTDGEKALDFLLKKSGYENSSRPDLLLLDVNLPRKNGFEVILEMKREENLKKIPIFLFTGSQSKEDRAKGLALGANLFLSKPSQLKEFQELIDRLLNVEFPLVLKAGGNQDE